MLGMLTQPDPGRRHLEEVFGGKTTKSFFQRNAAIEHLQAAKGDLASQCSKRAGLV